MWNHEREDNIRVCSEYSRRSSFLVMYRHLIQIQAPPHNHTASWHDQTDIHRLACPSTMRTQDFDCSLFRFTQRRNNLCAFTMHSRTTSSPNYKSFPLSGTILLVQQSSSSVSTGQKSRIHIPFRAQDIKHTRYLVLHAVPEPFHFAQEQTVKRHVSTGLS